MKFREGKSWDNAGQWSSLLARLRAAFISSAGAPRAFACLLAVVSGHLWLLADIYRAFLSHSSLPWVSTPLTGSLWWCLGGGCLQGCNGCLFPCTRIVSRLHQPLRHQLQSSSIVDEFNELYMWMFESVCPQIWTVATLTYKQQNTIYKFFVSNVFSASLGFLYNHSENVL